MSKKRKDKLQKPSELKGLNKKLKDKIQHFKQSLETSENYVNSFIPSLLSGAFFTYNFSNQEFLGHPSLNLLLGDMLEYSSITKEIILDNIPPDDKLSFQELFIAPKILTKKVNFQFRIIPKSKDYREIQSFVLSGTYSTKDNGDTLLICAIRNISRDNKTMRDLQRNLEKTEEADRIKTLFLLNISHNIRTPMNSILGFAELLSMTDPGPERRREFIDVIKKQSKNLLQLIDDVAEIAKYESGKMTITKSPINLNLLLSETRKDVVAMQSSNRKEQVEILVNLPNQSGMEIFSDAGRIHQIFLNLVGHSLKYTLEGSVELGYLIPDDNRISFFLKDTSQDINKEDLKLILDKYIQPDKTGESRYDEEVGLNLSIAKSIVKLLGGKISVDNTPEGGIEFVFTIPFEKIPSLASEINADEAQLNQQYKWTDKVILIVEDEEVNGLFLEAVFQETGAQTLHAKNGNQAVELCHSMLNKIDLVLMDIKMPVMNGLKATQEIRKFNTRLPIIAQTALALEEDREQCLLAGCNDAITKPIEIDELLRIVNSYFA